MRDDFSEATKLLLAKRVGTICSNPECCAPTYGPNHDPHKTTSKGVAAHLTAASPGGPRYDESLTPEQRRDYSNGIWLCQSCARIIDMDEGEYTLSLLKSWKEKAEDRAKRALKNPSLVNAGPNFAETILIVIVQRRALSMTPPPDLNIPPGHVARRKITLKPVKVPHDLKNPQIMLNFTPANHVPKGKCLISIVCQNQGTGLDQNIKIDIQFQSGAILNYRLMNQERIQCINGGGQGSWSASFAIANLLPGEYRSAIVAAFDKPFEVKAWSQNSHREVGVFCFDISFGEYETVPRENSPFREEK